MAISERRRDLKRRRQRREKRLKMRPKVAGGRRSRPSELRKAEGEEAVGREKEGKAGK